MMPLSSTILHQKRGRYLLAEEYFQIDRFLFKHSLIMMMLIVLCLQPFYFEREVGTKQVLKFSSTQHLLLFFSTVAFLFFPRLHNNPPSSADPATFLRGKSLDCGLSPRRPVCFCVCFGQKLRSGQIYFNLDPEMTLKRRE